MLDDPAVSQAFVTEESGEILLVGSRHLGVEERKGKVEGGGGLMGLDMLRAWTTVQY